KLADAEIALACPRHIERSRRLLAGSGKVKKRWQQRPRFDSARLHDLGNRQMLHGAVFPRAGVKVGHRTIGRAQIDADYVAGLSHCVVCIPALPWSCLDVTAIRLRPAAPRIHPAPPGAWQPSIPSRASRDVEDFP